MSKGRTVTFKGNAANNFIAVLMVEADGENARTKCAGEMLEAVNRVLEEKAKARRERAREDRGVIVERETMTPTDRRLITTQLLVMGLGCYQDFLKLVVPANLRKCG